MTTENPTTTHRLRELSPEELRQVTGGCDSMSGSCTCTCGTTCYHIICECCGCGMICVDLPDLEPDGPLPV